MPKSSEPNVLSASVIAYTAAVTDGSMMDDAATNSFAMMNEAARSWAWMRRKLARYQLIPKIEKKAGNCFLLLVFISKNAENSSKVVFKMEWTQPP